MGQTQSPLQRWHRRLMLDFIDAVDGRESGWLIDADLDGPARWGQVMATLTELHAELARIVAEASEGQVSAAWLLEGMQDDVPSNAITAAIERWIAKAAAMDAPIGLRAPAQALVVQAASIYANANAPLMVLAEAEEEAAEEEAREAAEAAEDLAAAHADYWASQGLRAGVVS